MSWVVGIDALRLCAIALIVAYHFFRGVLPGGFLAIEIFLVISGYLLGTKLLNTYKKEKAFRGGKFILRRIARLWPALFVCVVLTLCLALFSPHGVLEGLHIDTLFALLFSTNIQEIVQGGSYEDLTMPNLFEHCWFLALEFQLCLSLLIVLNLATIRARSFKKLLQRTFWLSLGIALVSAVLMYVYAVIFGEEDRAYFAPDTQAFAFYGGVALAAWRLLRPLPYRRRRWPAALALVLVTGVFLTLARLIDFSRAFAGYLQLAALLGVLFVAAILRLQRRRTSLPTGLRPLEYLGKYAFGIYLFHWPLYILLPRMFQLNETSNALLCTVLSLVLAIIAGKILNLRPRRCLLCLALPTGFAIFALFSIPVKSNITTQLEAMETEREVQKISYAQELNMDTLLETVHERGAEAQGAEEEAAHAWAPPVSASPSTNVNAANVLVIGDSVTLGAKAGLEATIPGVYVDAMESRGIEKAHVILDSVAASGSIPPVVIVSLATNQRSFTDAIMQQVVDSARGSAVVFVTAYASEAQPRDVQNAAIRNFANTHDNVYYADWWEIAIQHPELLYDDHIHLNPEGRRAYANLIYLTLQENGLL